MKIDHSNPCAWPALDYHQWQDTLKTVHRWFQIVGKVRLAKSPWVNHAWHSTLYVYERGLTTSIIHEGGGAFSIEFDFHSHALRITKDNDQQLAIPLKSMSVASFYDECIGGLAKLGIAAHIFEQPNELPDITRFSEDQLRHTYDPEYIGRFWRVLLQCDRVMKLFRSRFSGKVSPVHFFWGSFDLAVSRFSGRRAPEHPGGVPHFPDLLCREAYSHEVSSCGFWPGSELLPEPAFYSYVYPAPPGFAEARILEGAYFHEGMKEFILPYDVVRRADAPDELLLDFFQRTYDLAADLGKWNRNSLGDSPYLKQLHSLEMHKYTAA